MNFGTEIYYKHTYTLHMYVKNYKYADGANFLGLTNLA
jgi:hypothetical protein